MNENIADISAFEGLQNQANASMGCQPMGSMAVFNNAKTDKSIQDIKKEFMSVRKTFDDNVTALEKARADYLKAKSQNLPKQMEVFKRNFSDAQINLNKLAADITKMQADVKAIPNDALVSDAIKMPNTKLD